MNKKDVKPSIVKAYGFSFLVCLATSVLFGLIYGFGYYLYLVPIAGILLSMIVFNKFTKTNWVNILVSFVWCTVWLVLLNITAVYITEGIFICMEGYDLITAFGLLNTLLQTSEEASNLFIKIITESTLITVFCAAIGLAYFIGSYVVNKKKEGKSKDNSENTSTTIQDANIELLYFNLFSTAKRSLERFNNDKDKELLKADMEELRTTYLEKLSQEEKDTLVKIIDAELNKENLGTTEKNALTLLYKMIKNQV